MANKKLSELTTATGQTTSWFIPICDPSTGLAYKITAANFSTLIGGGGGDVTAPTVVSAIAATATTIVVTFSESVTATIAGWSFKKNGSAWTIVNVTGSGTVWTFNMATSASLGDTLLRTYDSGTGATIDASANELVSFTDSAVTNSIGDTTAPTVSSATISKVNEITLVFSESVTVTTSGWSFKKNGGAWTASSVSGSGTTWAFLMSSNATSSDTILRSYDSTTGNTIDNASNELVSFTDSAVTNSIAIPHNSPFTAANGTTIAAYIPTTGNMWTEAYGTGEIQSNKAVPLTFSSGEWQAYTDVGQTTFTLTTVIAGTKGAYIFFRRVDASNMMFVTVDFSANLVKLWKDVAGVVTQVGGNVTPSPTISDAADHTFVLTVGASTCTLTIDGNAAFTGASIDAAASGTIVGIGATGAGVAAGDIQYNSFNVVA